MNRGRKLQADIAEVPRFVEEAGQPEVGLRDHEAELVAAGKRHFGQVESYFTYAPDRVAQVQQLFELERLVLGSATPSLETMRGTETGRIEKK